MDWYQIKKHLYYTHDDFVRDIIALHLKKGAVKGGKTKCVNTIVGLT